MSALLFILLQITVGAQLFHSIKHEELDVIYLILLKNLKAMLTKQNKIVFSISGLLMYELKLNLYCFLAFL